MKSFSVYKRIRKSRNALNKGNGVIISNIIFLFMILMMSISCISMTISSDYDAVEDAGEFILFTSNVIWMSMFYFSTKIVLPSILGKMQRSMVKGNANVTAVYIHFPVTKKDCIRFSFIEFVKVSLMPICLGIYLCIASNIFEHIEVAKGEIGLMVLIMVVFLIIVEFFSIILVDCSKKTKSIMFTILTILYLSLFIFSCFLSDLSFVKNFYGHFKSIAGPIGIVLLVLVIPIAYLLTKILVLDRKGKEAWYYEENR